MAAKALTSSLAWFFGALTLFACARVQPGNEPESELNSPRCVTDIECGRDQRCFKEEKRPDGICAPKNAHIAVEPAAETPKTCKHDKECGGNLCSKKLRGAHASCVYCDADVHQCRTMHTDR